MLLLKRRIPALIEKYILYLQDVIRTLNENRAPISMVLHPLKLNETRNEWVINHKVNYCYHCGSRVKNQKYCGECGFKLDWNDITAHTKILNERHLRR